MLPASDKEESSRNYLKLAQIYAAIQRREHEQRRKMVIKNILEKEGDINYKIPATDYMKSFKTTLIDCSALHLAFSASNIDIFNHILQYGAGADFTIMYNDMTVIHRAVEENFNKHEMSKLAKRFKQYTNARFTTQDINSFILMSTMIEQKNVNECDNWRLRSQLEDPFIDSILSAHIKYNNSANPHSRNGISHFHAACMTNNFKAVELFLKNGIDVNESVNIDSPIYSGYAPIHFAVRCSGLETIEELLKYKVNVDVKDSQGKTPLEILIDHNIKIREWIDLKQTLPYENSIADYMKNEKIINLLINSSDKQDDPLYFYAACTLNSTGSAENMLKNLTNINVADDSSSTTWPGYTALHFASIFNMDIVKLLLKNGANIEVKDKNGVSPLDILIRTASVKDMHFILSTKDEWKNIVFSDGKTRLLDVISSMENPNNFNRFLKTVNIFDSLPVDSPLWPGYTILHLAVTLSETVKLQKILNGISDPTDVDYKKELNKCCQEQQKVHLENVLACLSANANVFIQDARGRTPIHLAFRKREMSIVKLLLLRVNIPENVVDEDNLSILHIACAAGCREMATQLMSSKDINMPILSSFKWDSNYYGCAAEDVFKIAGSTPLHIATSKEDLELVNLLVDESADVNAKDAAGLTAINRIFAMKNIWKIGNDIFHWSDVRRPLMLFDSPEMDWYQRAMSNIKDISKTLLSSPTLKDNIDRNFNIHQRPPDDTNHSYNFESGETLVLQGIDILGKRDNGSIWLFDKLKYPYREDIDFITTILRQQENIKNRLRHEFGWTTLHVACSLFSVELAKESIDAGIDVNTATFNDSPIYRKCTPLHILMMSLDGRRSYHESKEDYEAVLQILLDNGADVSLTDLNNDTPLHRSDYSRFWTSRSFKDSIYTEVLLDHIKNFEVNPINDKGLSIFHLACLKQNYRAIAEFLKCGVDVNLPVNFFAFETLDMDEFAGFTPLHLLVKEPLKSTDVKSLLEIVELLLMHGADVNLVDAFGDTALHVAAVAENPQEKLFELLIEKGANIFAENVSGKTPLERLLHSRNASKKDIEVFLNRGCRLNTVNPLSQVGYMALLICFKVEGEIRKSVEMAMNCPSINDIDEMGRTAIHNIVSNIDFPDGDDFDVIEHFMRYGGDIDRQDRLGRTALHMAAQFRNFGAVRGLLSSGADINIVDAKGQTAFAYALDPETCLVDQTLDFNVSVNKHLVIHAFAEYVYNMQLRGVYMDEVNKLAQVRAVNDFHVRLQEISSSFENIRNEKIGSSSLKLDDFMSETGAIVAYPKKSPAERQEIDQFFTVTIKDDRFHEWRFLCKLQYRKALARGQMIDLASDALNVILGLPLPYLCFDVIQQFLANADLKNLIATMP